jgi:hypothetical protein
MTPQRAREFRMMIGKFKGQTLDEIYRKQPGYVEWLARTMDRAIGRAAKGYLQLCKPERN